MDRAPMTGTMAFIQARMSSSRFPGKVLEPVGGVPMIVYMARRAQRADTIDQVAIVTSVDASDNTLAATAQSAGLPVFRGSLEDVLARFAEAAQAFGAREIVRLTGDCPLIDPAVIDAVVSARRARGVEYASNIDPPMFPDGLDVECFTRAALDRARREARLPSQREHVTLWMRSDPAPVTRANVTAIADFSHLRLTVDYPDDLEVVRSIVAQAPEGRAPDLFDILRILGARPEILMLNPHARNEGLLKSLALDRDSPGASS
jgi:spore coat polysaccharide biosynthesis protein SpsF (cytidylyltransferase family)